MGSAIFSYAFARALLQQHAERGQLSYLAQLFSPLICIPDSATELEAQLDGLYDWHNTEGQRLVLSTQWLLTNESGEFYGLFGDHVIRWGLSHAPAYVCTGLQHLPWCLQAGPVEESLLSGYQKWCLQENAPLMVATMQRLDLFHRYCASFHW